MYESLIFATVICGFMGMLFKSNLFMKILSMDAMSTGVICYFVYIASKSGYFSPIITEKIVEDYSDPIPQAVILTAIVIGFSIQAIMLVAVIKLSRDHPFLNSEDIEDSFS